jgi:hypothetical protein
LTESSTDVKDDDSTGSSEREMATNKAETGILGRHAHPAPFAIRKRIGSTAYEVEVYFSSGAEETMDDKILRLVRGGAAKSDMEGRK